MKAKFKIVWRWRGPIWPPLFYKALAIHIDQATPGGIR